MVLRRKTKEIVKSLLCQKSSQSSFRKLSGIGVVAGFPSNPWREMISAALFRGAAFGPFLRDSLTAALSMFLSWSSGVKSMVVCAIEQGVDLHS